MQENLTRQVVELKLTLADKGERLKLAETDLASLRRDSERAKQSAKYDLIAREGRTKKLGILEHTVETLRHDLRTNVNRR